MRQMMCADKKVTRRERHVPRELMLNSKVALIGVCVFEFFIWEKSERQNRAKAWERLVIEALAPKLILRARRRPGRAVDAGDSSREITNNDRALEDLRGIKKSGRGRIVKCQRGLLLLRRVRNVGVESDS